MEKKTFVPERKAYLAPAAKSHLIQVEENIMSDGYNTDTWTEYLSDESDGGDLS